MLGFSAFAETAFGATVAHAGVTDLVTCSGVTVSQNANGITFTISGSVSPTGSQVTISDGAEEVNVITWPPIDPDVSMTWTNIDPL